MTPPVAISPTAALAAAGAVVVVVAIGVGARDVRREVPGLPARAAPAVGQGPSVRGLGGPVLTETPTL